MSDIVDDIFTRIKTILGNDFNGDIVLKIEAEEDRVRKDWGGDGKYIKKKKNKDKRREQVISEIRQGNSVAVISRNTGMSKVHIYRLLKSK